MANTDIAMGLKPVQHRNGAPYNGAFRLYSTPAGNAVAVFIGDPVILLGTSQTINGRIYSDVAQAATGGVVSGVVVGVMPVTQDSTRHRVASTQRLLMVADDPELLFEVQEVSGGTALTANDAGLNIDFVVGTGSAVTGLSGVEINNASEATTATLDLHIVGPVAKEDNAIGEHCKWLVTINRHQFANQVAGI